RLIAVDIAFALFALAAAEDALLERTVLLELGSAGFKLLLRHVAVAAGAAELQHKRERVHARTLRPVRRAFRKISDGARRHSAVAVEIKFAFELVAELIEIMFVAGGKEVVGRAHHFENEVSRRARFTGGHGAMAKRALAMLMDADLFLHLIPVHDSHGVLRIL